MARGRPLPASLLPEAALLSRAGAALAAFRRSRSVTLGAGSAITRRGASADNRRATAALLGNAGATYVAGGTDMICAMPVPANNTLANPLNNDEKRKT